MGAHVARADFITPVRRDDDGLLHVLGHPEPFLLGPLGRIEHHGPLRGPGIEDADSSRVSTAPIQEVQCSWPKMRRGIGQHPGIRPQPVWKAPAQSEYNRSTFPLPRDPRPIVSQRSPGCIALQCEWNFVLQWEWMG